MTPADMVRVDVSRAATVVVGGASVCTLCSRQHLKRDPYKRGRDIGCNSGEWNCDGIIWLSRVDHAALVMEGKL